MTAPSLAVFMICKNEEAHIGKALASVAGVARAAIVCDTGSTDDTGVIVRGLSTPCFAVKWTDYFGASEKDDAGDWKLWDFAKARNHAAAIAEEFDCSHVMWLDADDIVVNPERIARAIYRDDVDVFAMTVESGGMRWLHHRMWRTDKHVRFHGRCHEYPIIDGLRATVLDVTIKHDSAAVEGQENSNARNLRLLMRDWEEHPDDSRTAFYIAQTHKDAGRHAEAFDWYVTRIALGTHYRDELMFARMYAGRSLMALENYKAARFAFETGRAEAPDWHEFTVALAWLEHKAKNYPRAIELALVAFDTPIPPTELWREVNAYTDQPCRILSFCYEAQGDIGKACAWARMALDRIGMPDPQWQARIATLEAQLTKAPTPHIVEAIRDEMVDRVAKQIDEEFTAPAIVTRRKERIAIVRPGAIGDVLMTLNLLPAFKEANPDAEIHYYTKVEGLDNIISAAGAIPHHGALLFGNHDRAISLVGYPLAEGYPEKPMRRHLLDYFAEEMGIIFPSTHYGNLPALELPLPPRPSSCPREDYATLQVTAGWSKYKQWRHWPDLVWDHLPFKVVQILGEGEEAIGGCYMVRGALPDAIAAVANARIHLGIDSFANHLTNYFWRDGRSARRVPGVILWGSTQWQAAGYPHNINISKGLYCQPCFRENDKISQMPRGPCVNPPRPTYADDTPWRCMEEITVDEVVEAALKLWEQSGRADNSRHEPASSLCDLASDDPTLPRAT